MVLSPAETSHAREGFPWRESLVFGLITACVYLILPGLAPSGVTGEIDIALLGLLLGLIVGLGSRLDPRVAPSLAVGAFVGVVARFAPAGYPPFVVLLLAAIIGIEIWAMIALVRRTHAGDLDRPQDVLLLVGISLGVGVIAGVSAGALFELTGFPEQPSLRVMRSWAVDDVFGVLCVAPALMTLRRPSTWSWRFVTEYALVVAISLGIGVYVFRVVTPDNPGTFGWPYLVILGPLWVAIRFGVAAVTPLTAAIAWLAIASTVDRFGVFAAASDEPVRRLVAAELFCITMSITLLLAAILRDSRQRSLDRLRESSRLLREVVDGSSALIFAKSYRASDAESGRYVMVNRAWETDMGISATDTLERSDAELFPREFADDYLAKDRAVLEADTGMELEERGRSATGELRYYNSSKFPLRDEEGRAWGVGGIATDTTELVHGLERERRQGDLLRAVFELSPTPAMRLTMTEDARIDVLDVNTAMCRLMGVADGARDECDLLTHVHPDDVSAAMDALGQAVQRTTARRPGSRQREVRIIRDDGSVVWTLMSAAAVGTQSSTDEVEIVAQFEDFTARRLAEEALTDQALRDPVTGLPNRRALHDRLESALQRLHRSPGMIAVLFCDLDHFKDVNDTLGHQAGDDLLVHVAGRMQSALRPGDTVARLGGDEFVALSEGIAETSDAMQLAVRLQDRIKSPWVSGGTSFRPSVSIGVAVVDDQDVTADEVLRRADLAMYRAKENGRSRIETYERAVDERFQLAVALQHDLRRAIDTDSLVLHYQPIVTLTDADVVGAEALVRMPGRDGVLLEPGWFVPQAETSGLIVPMGAWVVRRAIVQLRAWEADRGAITVSVNVSPSQLRDEGFATFVLKELEATGVDPRRLGVEVTETALLNEPGRSARELTALSREGVSIYLDDFGTGYSSLSWLTQFPVNVVKIDRSFTEELGFDDRKSAIVSALIQVSHELGFSVVAEGVETEQQLERLIELGCDRGQGFLFGRPVPVDQAPWVA